MTDTTNEVVSNNGQLGNIVSWRVPAHVSIEKLRAALVSAKLDTGLAADLAPRNALTRALRDMSKARVIRRLKRDGDTLTFQLNQQIRENGHYDYPHECDVHLDVASGYLTCANLEVEQQARTLLAEHTGKRLTSDLTRLLQRVFDQQRADLIPIRESGGAYFVPDRHSALVDSARVLLREIGGNLRTFSVRLGSDDTSESVAESMVDYLSGLVEEFKLSCADLSSDSRQDKINRRENRIGELRSKLECYRGLLRGFADSIDVAIDQAEEELFKKLMASAAAPEAPAVEAPAQPPAAPSEPELFDDDIQPDYANPLRD